MWWIIPAVIGAVILCVIVVALLPVGLRIIYDREGLKLRLLIGFIPVKFSLKEINAFQKKRQNSSQQNKEPQESSDGKVIRPDGSLSEFFELIKFATQLLFNDKRKVKVRLLELNLILANDDPFDLAMNYGRTQAIINGIMPQLERFLNIKRRKLDVACDFLAEETSVYVRGDLTMPVIRLLIALYNIATFKKTK